MSDRQKLINAQENQTDFQKCRYNELDTLLNTNLNALFQSNL